jgi:hypothetical protein
MPASEVLGYFGTPTNINEQDFVSTNFGTPTTIDGQDFPSTWIYESVQGDLAYEMQGTAIVGLAIQHNPVYAVEANIAGAQTPEFQLTIQFDATQRVRGFSYDTTRSQGL